MHDPRSIAGCLPTKAYMGIIRHNNLRYPSTSLRVSSRGLRRLPNYYSIKFVHFYKARSRAGVDYLDLNWTMMHCSSRDSKIISGYKLQYEIRRW